MTDTDTTYNGWTNKATWLVKLWIDNDQGSQAYWLEAARDRGAYDLSEMLKEEFEEAADDEFEGIISKAGFYSDLMSWALAMVDWSAVARTLIEDAAEVNA